VDIRLSCINDLQTQGTLSPEATAPLPKILSGFRKDLQIFPSAFRETFTIFGSGVVAPGENVPCVCDSFRATNIHDFEKHLDLQIFPLLLIL